MRQRAFFQITMKEQFSCFSNQLLSKGNYKTARLSRVTQTRSIDDGHDLVEAKIWGETISDAANSDKFDLTA